MVSMDAGWGTGFNPAFDGPAPVPSLVESNLLDQQVIDAATPASVADIQAAVDSWSGEDNA
jgi:hypothetical protein